MKKDLNILKYKDVSVKTTSSQKNIFYLIIVVGIIAILLVGLLFIKLNKDLGKLELDNKSLEDQKTQLNIKKNQNNPNNFDKEILKINKELQKDKRIVDDLLSNTGSLDYGILQDLIEKPDASTDAKETFGNLLSPEKSIDHTFIRLQDTPNYSIDGQEFKATFTWTLFAPKLEDTPSASEKRVDIFSDNYALNKYKKYLQNLLVDGTLKDNKAVVNLSGFQQSNYSGTGVSGKNKSDEDDKYDKYSFIVGISINVTDYDYVINILKEKYKA